VTKGEGEESSSKHDQRFVGSMTPAQRRSLSARRKRSGQAVARRTQSEGEREGNLIHFEQANPSFLYMQKAVLLSGRPRTSSSLRVSKTRTPGNDEIEKYGRLGVEREERRDTGGDAWMKVKVKSKIGTWPCCH